MSEGTRCRIYRRLYFATPRVSNVEKLLWGGNSQEFPNCRRPGTDRWLRSKGRAALNFREPSTRFRHCCSRNRRHISVTSLLPPRSGCCWWLALQKSELRNTGSRERGEAVCDAAWTTSPTSSSSSSVEIRESFLSWLEFTSRLFFFFSKCNSRIVYVDD